MFIISEKKSLRDVTLILQPDEATQMISYITQLLEDVSSYGKEHCHLNDALYQKEITVCLINDDISSFHPDIRKLMEKELDE